MYYIGGILASLLVLCLQIDTGLTEEICKTEDGIVSFCDVERTYCCYNGTACCWHGYTETKIVAVGFLCLCAGALLIPITCTICAYCIFNVILKKRNTSNTKDDPEADKDNDPVSELNFPIGCQTECTSVPEVKKLPEVFISPDEFLCELKSKNSDKIYLIKK